MFFCVFFYNFGLLSYIVLKTVFNNRLYYLDNFTNTINYNKQYNTNPIFPNCMTVTELHVNQLIFANMLVCV